LCHSVNQSQYIGLRNRPREQGIQPGEFGQPFRSLVQSRHGSRTALHRRSRQGRPRFPFPAIETWQNQFPGYEILIDDPELTSVCPKTGLPDFGVLTIRYMPRQRCLELKSLKEYLFSYRNLGIFQENIVNQVLEDVVKACDPVWAVVRGEFRPRGGIGTTVEARWPRPAA
jgi:7-cyano-7-deazaguanine reductase